MASELKLAHSPRDAEPKRQPVRVKPPAAAAEDGRGRWLTALTGRPLAQSALEPAAKRRVWVKGAADLPSDPGPIQESLRSKEHSLRFRSARPPARPATE